MSFRIPDSARSNPAWTLLPLRGFLAFTFLYAGLSKIGNRSFFDDSDPSSMHSTVVAVKATSPIGGLLQPVVDHSLLFGLPMALGEVAVGIGMLLGLFSRLAALGGMVLALSLFLTVSWGADPWYTGADIVYVFAFTPILLAGATPFSVDEWLARAREQHPGESADRTRRAVLVGGAAVAGLVTVGAASLFRGTKSAEAAAEPAPADTSATTGGAAIIAASSVPVGGGAAGKDPKSGDEIWVLQLDADNYTAYNATCPHQQCAVKFLSKSKGFACPCHNSTFDSSGKVTQGPATKGLTKVAVTESGGQIVQS
ncbi:MAG: Rieske (2Fe-2S) domain protein [Pseudonocardiales bacterium]|nr:Rieske (2Fe-2S) domain protein [Pseudonocardiales bacterium]